MESKRKFKFTVESFTFSLFSFLFNEKVSLHEAQQRTEYVEIQVWNMLFTNFRSEAINKLVLKFDLKFKKEI